MTPGVIKRLSESAPPSATVQSEWNQSGGSTSEGKRDIHHYFFDRKWNRLYLLRDVTGILETGIIRKPSFESIKHLKISVDRRGSRKFGTVTVPNTKIFVLSTSENNSVHPKTYVTVFWWPKENSKIPKYMFKNGAWMTLLIDSQNNRFLVLSIHCVTAVSFTV